MDYNVAHNITDDECMWIPDYKRNTYNTDITMGQDGTIKYERGTEVK